MNSEVYFNNIEFEVIKRIKKATSNIRVAMAWFTNLKIYTAIKDAALRGVKVEFVLMSDDINANSKLDFNLLKISGVILHWYSSSDSGLMHHKFCIIDDEISLTGSYNWTVSASHKNHENLTVISDRATAKEFTKEFFYLRELSTTEHPSLIPSFDSSTDDYMLLHNIKEYTGPLDPYNFQISICAEGYKDNPVEIRAYKKSYKISLDKLETLLNRLCIDGSYEIIDVFREGDEDDDQDDEYGLYSANSRVIVHRSINGGPSEYIGTFRQVFKEVAPDLGPNNILRHVEINGNFIVASENDFNAGKGLIKLAEHDVFHVRNDGYSEGDNDEGKLYYDLESIQGGVNLTKYDYVYLLSNSF